MRQRTIAAFDEWRSSPDNWSMLIQRVAMGETLKDVCAGQGLAYSLVARHIASTPALNAEYEAARRIWADALAQETIGIVDGATPDTVAVEKLRSEARFKLAGKLDRERYGEAAGVAVQVNVNLGDVAREIRVLEERLGLRSPQAEAIEVLPATVPIDQNEGVI